MCVYQSCLFPCITKFEHHSKYATMRRRRINNVVDNKLEIAIKSPKVNWDIVEKMNINTVKKDKRYIRYKTPENKERIDNEYILDLN